jgi:alpha-glucosidase
MTYFRWLTILSVLWACGNNNDGMVCGPGTEAHDGECLPVEADEDSGSPDTQDTEVPDTGDTGEPPPTGRCSSSPDFTNPTNATGRFEIGNFIVQLDETGELYALHNDDYSKAVFHSSTAPWLVVGDHELHAEEHQGSFDIETHEAFSCNQARFTEARTSDGAVQFSGVFDDEDERCTETAFELVLCEESEGRLAFNLTPESTSPLTFSSIRIRSNSNERFYGMGEQFPHDTLNLKGRQISVLSQEGGVGRGHPIISTAVDLVSPGSAGNEGTTYYSAPQYITSELKSIFLKNTAYAEFDFREEAYTEIRLFDDSLSWEAVYGKSPLQLIERFTEYAGRMPPPPDWTQSGAIVALARPLEESLSLIESLVNAGVEVAGVWNQTWSGINVTYIGEQVLWNWVLDEEEHPGWQDWVSELASQDIRTLCYINSMFLDLAERETPPARHLFEEGEAGGYFVKDENGDTLLLPVTAFDVALLDFTNESARDWMKAIIIDEMVEQAGCSGWMVDFAEALPFEATLHDGSAAADYHNQYPVEWMRLNREALEEAGLVGEILTFNRSGHTQSPAQSLMFWEGDQLTTWDKYDGLTSAVRGLINGGFSGLALNHSDTGGYTSLSRLGLGYSREAELLKRWGEFSAFTSLLRTHEGNQPESNAQVYDNDQKEHFAWVSRVFAGLHDYRLARFEEAEAWGWPVVRHLWLHYPTDAMAHQADDQFLLGEGFLIAPVLEKCGWRPWCVSERDVYLPEGEWTHLWSGDVYTGPASIQIEAPMQEPPVFYNSIDPEALEAVDTLRAYNVGIHNEFGMAHR